MEDYTYDDYIGWDGRWELIGGIPIPTMPIHIREYRDISIRALLEFESAIKDCDLCLVVGSADWKIENDTIVRPEISIICNEPNGAYITKPPKLILEIVEERRADYYENIKFDLYKNNGVNYYILLYLYDSIDKQVAEVFKLLDDEYIKCGRVFYDGYEFQIDECEFHIDFGKIFGEK